jgi:hypothetical protein
MHAAMEKHEKPPNKRLTPFPVMVANVPCIAAAATRSATFARSG